MNAPWRPGGPRVLVGGVAVAVLYLAGAAFSGHLSPLARRPLLDGIGPPPPYQWVSPPPSLAAGNTPAEPGSATLKMTPGGSAGGVVSTRDLQVTVIFKDGAFASAPGATGVDVVVTPLDPGTLGAPPATLATTGNAYTVAATYAGASGSAAKLADAADLSMVYPATASSGLTHVEHVILSSSDGRSWARIPTSDASGALTAAASIDALGYFVVAEPKSAATAEQAPGRSYLPFIVGAVGLLLLLISSPRVLGWVRRRGRREEEGWRR
jgi:hypothetical protein